MLSMTGYGRGSSCRGSVEIIVEMRSVNHRYADFILRLPREMHPLEEKMRRILQQEVKRGRLELSVAMAETPCQMQEVAVNFELASAYHTALAALAQRLDLSMDISAGFLGSLPGVLDARNKQIDLELIWDSLEEALRESLAELIRQRSREGANLYEDLACRCRRLEELAGMVSFRAPQILEEHRLRLARKLDELLGSLFEESRILTECALISERTGIEEELVRLGSHLQAFRLAMDDRTPVGRKLDFITQEMLRETNTIAAKCGDYQLAGLTVEMKSELEKIREQVQNIE